MPAHARSDATRRSYRGQLTLALITLGVFLTALIVAAVAGAWPAVALVAPFVAGWIARVLMVVRFNRLGGYSADPPSDARTQYRSVLRTMAIAWTLVSLYFVVTQFWWALLTSIPLASFSVLLLRVLPKR
ncbi:hypothetical protein [Kribbella sp. NPDC051718]|uniref:hypothetical protein n=1 Tax=Kribbella sp. NPDC051718 TaxID=3155168 RepID=UPI00343F9546